MVKKEEKYAEKDPWIRSGSFGFRPMYLEDNNDERVWHNNRPVRYPQPVKRVLRAVKRPLGATPLWKLAHLDASRRPLTLQMLATHETLGLNGLYLDPGRVHARPLY
jgi:hypothetical protein